MKQKQQKLLYNIFLTEFVIFILLLIVSNILKDTKKEEEVVLTLSRENELIAQEHIYIEENQIDDEDMQEVNADEQLEDESDENSDINNVSEDGVSGKISGVDNEYIDALQSAQAGSLLQSKGAIDVIYYMQSDARWANAYYGGTDTMEVYACGPTSMSIVVSSLTDIKIDPVQMANWANQNGYWYPKSGSLHSFIPDAAKAFGLNSEGVENTPEAIQKISTALQEGKLVVALMGKGQFTRSGHFIVLRGITSEGKILVADPASKERTNQEWDVNTIVKEAKAWANANGPFWIISTNENSN